MTAFVYLVFLAKSSLQHFPYIKGKMFLRPIRYQLPDAVSFCCFLKETPFFKRKTDFFLVISIRFCNVLLRMHVAPSTYKELESLKLSELCVDIFFSIVIILAASIWFEVWGS